MKTLIRLYGVSVVIDKISFYKLLVITKKKVYRLDYPLDKFHSLQKIQKMLNDDLGFEVLVRVVADCREISFIPLLDLYENEYSFYISNLGYTKSIDYDTQNYIKSNLKNYLDFRGKNILISKQYQDILLQHEVYWFLSHLIDNLLLSDLESNYLSPLVTYAMNLYNRSNIESLKQLLKEFKGV